MIKDIQTELGRLKTGIDDAKTNLAKLQGREQELLRQLKADHGLTTTEEAKSEVRTLKDRVAKSNVEIEKLYEELRREYEW